jgi:hypothetical protein
MNHYLYEAQWKDEVASMKWIRILPPNDPNNWYWFISLRTKNCSSPFYISYDSYDTNLGEIFVVEHVWPKEYQAYLDKLRANIPLSEMDAEGKKELANKYFTLIKKRMQIFITDTILVFVNKACHSMIDTITLKYPETEREAKRQELWTALEGSENYKKSILYLKTNHLVSSEDIYNTLDSYSQGTIERAINIFIRDCQQSLWVTVNYMKEDSQSFLINFIK